MDDIGNRQGEALGVAGGILLAICILAVAAVLLLSQMGAGRVGASSVTSGAAQESPAVPTAEPPATP